MCVAHATRNSNSSLLESEPSAPYLVLWGQYVVKCVHFLNDDTKVTEKNEFWFLVKWIYKMWQEAKDEWKDETFVKVQHKTKLTFLLVLRQQT